MNEPTALAQLRHLYQNMVNGAVRDTASAKRIAEGLLAPAIEALERGTPQAVAAEPVAPDFYTACALYEEGGEAGWIPLPGYSNETEHGVKHLVLESARKEGYKGTADGRLVELGWEIRPVYLTPQPTQAQAGAVPLTDGQAKAVLWAEHLRWMEAAGLDTEGMQPTAEWLDHWLTYVRAIERAHGIT